MFYLTVFIVPMIFVLALGMLLALVLSMGLLDWLMSLGWDTHVLAWGALGGVFTNQGVDDSFGVRGAETAELVCVAILLLLAVGNLALRRDKKGEITGWRALAALAIGGFSLAVPIAVALHGHV